MQLWIQITEDAGFHVVCLVGSGDRRMLSARKRLEAEGQLEGYCNHGGKGNRT